MHRRLSFLSALALCAPSALASDTAAAGYALAAQPNPRFGAVTCTLPGGDFATFDGQTVERWSANGALLANLGSLPGFVYASFVEPTPDGLALVIADSGASAAPGGSLRVVRLDGSGISAPIALVYPFDGAFLPDGELLVSAATQGMGVGNDLVRVDLAGASATLIGHVAGPSGPLAVGRAGEVYYATQGPGFAPPPGSTDVLRWSAAQVAAGGLDESNASVVAAGFDGGSALALDPRNGALYLAYNDYALGVHRVLRVKGSAASSPALVASDLPILGLRFEDLGGGARFAPYQPDDGARLVYEASDFFSTSALVAVAPRRPVLAASGPGVSGVGALTLSVDGGVPNGTALLTYCPQNELLPYEVSYPLPHFLHRSPFPLSSTARFAFLIPTDAAGHGALQLWNPGGLEGAYGWQFMVGRANGVQVGSSNALSF